MTPGCAELERDAIHPRPAGGRDIPAVFPLEWNGAPMNIVLPRDPEGTTIEPMKKLDRT